MDRLLATLLVGVLLAAAIPATATLPADDDEMQPGASFAGVVGVQRAEVGNEVAQRSLDRRLAAANSNHSKAAVVANETERLDERLDELETRKERLRTAYENGSIGRGEYQARLAGLAAEIRAVERRANTTASAAAGLSPGALDETGVDANEVRSVASRANKVGGGEVAEAATRVAGKNVGNGISDAPGQRGPNGTAGPPVDNPATNDPGSDAPGSDNPGVGDAGPPNHSNTGGGPDGTGNGTDGGPNASPPGGAGDDGKPGECVPAQNCSTDDRPGEGVGAGSGNGSQPDDPGNGDGRDADRGQGDDRGQNGTGNETTTDDGTTTTEQTASPLVTGAE